MGGDTRADSCAPYDDDLAELALGSLAGRDRARVLDHVESCPRCAEELEQLTRVADTLVQVAPEAEAPLGFESRLFARMGVIPVEPARRRRPVPRWVPAVVATAAAALGLGLGLTLTSSSAPTATAHAASHGAVVSAPLMEHGQTVGRVAIGGSKPWLSMMLADSTARGRVDCLVVTEDGVTHRVGTFVADAGYGAWITPLTVDPADVRGAEVVSPSGTVIATATLG